MLGRRAEPAYQVCAFKVAGIHLSCWSPRSGAPTGEIVRIPAGQDSGGPVGAELRVEGKASIDEDGLTCDVGGLVGAEVGSQTRHLLRGAGASHGDMALYFCAGFWVVDPGAIDWGDSSSRGYAVDPDAMWRIFKGQCSCEILHSTFAR